MLSCCHEEIPEDKWEELVKEIDIDGDGEIEFDEFSKMMNKFVPNDD